VGNLEGEEKREEEAPLPVITVAREPGSIVTELVQQIAQELKLDIIDARIINEVAKSVRMSEKSLFHISMKRHAVYWTTGYCTSGRHGFSSRMNMCVI